ncbi:hypothetical protein TWF703_001725 [Orbilia oligospora]|uniref:Aminotransferase class I/classII large domain-containing protein n=1 Tax=Orbilia oligospora TaxID=2813651 RepID=A0A7C8NWD6_ORBOL|nr:hypothetical protein TWF703_001725 [Orbilia oligospora]
MSIFKTSSNHDAVGFHSVLSINMEDIVDPTRVHVLYGMSKDFSSNGLRLGLMVSRNQQLVEAMSSITIFSWPSAPADLAWCIMLEDTIFLEYYISEHRKRLGEGYEFLAGILDNLGIDYTRGSNAGFFVWADLSFALEQPEDGSEPGLAEDMRLDQKLIQNGVHLAAGLGYQAEKPGWFRITFSQPRPLLLKGLAKMMKLLKGVDIDILELVPASYHKATAVDSTYSSLSLKLKGVRLAQGKAKIPLLEVVGSHRRVNKVSSLQIEHDIKAQSSMRLQKELYYKLQHLETHYSILPQARDVLISLFSETLEKACKAPNTGILSIEQYSRDALLEFQQKEDNKVMDMWEQYLARRRAKGPREMFSTREEAKWWLLQSSPVKYVDGAWLGHINKITTPFGLRRVVKNAWQVLSEELGDGDLEKNHVYLYRQLMEAVEPGFPAGDDVDFIDPRHGLNEYGVWKAAIAQLLISLFPHQFLPEIIGFNMHYEAMALETLKVSKELKELGYDPYYFVLHISIDNADSGHTAIALETAMGYLELIQKRDGDAAAKHTWKRIQAGYILSKGLPTAPICPKFKTPNTVLPTERERFPRNSLEAEVIRIFKAKALVSQKIHCNSKVKFGGRTITEWLIPNGLESQQHQIQFLDALSNAEPWIFKGDSDKSRLMKELSWQGRMFGSFTQSEVHAVKQWIDSLGGNGFVSDPTYYWSFINEPELPSNTVFKSLDIRVHHPVFSQLPANNILAQLLPSTTHLPRAPKIETTVPANWERFFPLWFTHPCLLEHFICIPAQTTTPMVCSIIRVLRAQSGFGPEDSMVAGMDEVRRKESIGLVELGLEMIKLSGFMEPTCLKDVLETWKSDFGLLMLHLCQRPIENTGLLLGLAMAFVDLHDAVTLSPTLLSSDGRRLLHDIAKRERENLDLCLRELESTPPRFLDFCRGYHLGRAEIDRCFL